MATWSIKVGHTFCLLCSALTIGPLDHNGLEDIAMSQNVALAQLDSSMVIDEDNTPSHQGKLPIYSMFVFMSI